MASAFVDRSCCCLLMVSVKRKTSGWLLLHLILCPWFCLPSHYIMQIFLAESGLNIYSFFFHCMRWIFLDIFGLMSHLVNLLVKYCRCRLLVLFFPHHPVCKHLNTNVLLPTNENVTLQYNRPISFQASQVWWCSENSQHFWLAEANSWECLTPQELQSNYANDI